MSVLPRSTRAVLVAMALLGAASPDPLSGQQDALGTERLTAFAKAHVAMNEVRDEFHRQIGEIHEEQGSREGTGGVRREDRPDSPGA